MAFMKKLCYILFFLILFVNINKNVMAQDKSYGNFVLNVSVKHLYARIILPTYQQPFKDVEEGDLIYPLIEVRYLSSLLTNLTKENFSVWIGGNQAEIMNVSYNSAAGYYQLEVVVPYNDPESKQDFRMYFLDKFLQIFGIFYRKGSARKRCRVNT